MSFKYFVASALLCISLACQTALPTPFLIGKLVEQNNEVVRLYSNCSEGINYLPTLETCQPDVLETKTIELMSASINFIQADITQPQGYDIYLATALIYFRIGQRTLNEYTKAEQIAQQFFEVQKAHSGYTIDEARFYWPWFAAATAAKQFFEDPLSLNPERKAELIKALGEGTILMNRITGPRAVRLKSALDTLEFVISKI